MVVFDNGSEINMPAAKDIPPEVGRESWGTPLSVEATDCVFDVEVIDRPKDTGFLGIGNIGPMGPRSFSSSNSPVPRIVWVMDVFDVTGLLESTLLNIVLIPACPPKVVVVPELIFLRGNPKRSSRDFSLSPIRSIKGLTRVSVRSGCVSLSA